MNMKLCYILQGKKHVYKYWNNTGTEKPKNVG